MSNESSIFIVVFWKNLLVNVKRVAEFAVANHAYFFKKLDKFFFMFYIVVKFVLF